VAYVRGILWQGSGNFDLSRKAVSEVGNASGPRRIAGFNLKASLSTHLQVSLVFSGGFFRCSVMRWVLIAFPVVKTGFVFLLARPREHLPKASAPQHRKFNSLLQTVLKLPGRQAIRAHVRSSKLLRPESRGGCSEPASGPFKNF
jgi:hypothetical protein